MQAASNKKVILKQLHSFFFSILLDTVISVLVFSQFTLRNNLSLEFTWEQVFED